MITTGRMMGFTGGLDRRWIVDSVFHSVGVELVVGVDDS